MALLSDTCIMRFEHENGEGRAFMFGRIDRRAFMKVWEKQGKNTKWRLVEIEDIDFDTAQDALAELLEE